MLLMRKIKRKKIKLKRKLRALNRFLFFSSIFILILVIFGVIIIFHQTRPTTETSGSEMRKLPPEIKKNLMNQAVKATTSAQLRIPILMYHYVEYVQDRNDTIRQSLNINPDAFEKQIQTLINAGYTFMTAKELGRMIDGKSTLPKNPILLTFDDGHWDLDTSVLPMLKKYHVKATAYIIPGFLGGSDFMTKNQLQDVIDSGLVDIGAHTVHHVSLKGTLAPIVKYEVEQSKKLLESEYHIKVVSFAYPNGSFDQNAVDIVKEAGFTTSVSTIPGVVQDNENRFFLYRLRPGYRTGSSLLYYLQQNSFRAY